MVPPGDAVPHRTHEEDRPLSARTSRADPQLLPCSETAFQRRRRGSKQQSQGNNEKILWLPHLPNPGTRSLSLTWKAPRARINPRFFLTNHLNNVVEQDHRTVKKRVWLAKGYGSFQSAWRTL